MHLLENQFTEAMLQVSFKPSCNPIQASGSEQATAFLYRIWDKTLMNLQEQFYVLYLNNAQEILCWRCLHTGMITSVSIDMRLLFGFAFGCGATNIIIAHNHPSGKVKPSKADISLTLRVKKAGVLLDIPLLDHIILGKEGSFSFYQDKLL